MAGKRVLIIAQLDSSANGVKPVEMRRFLEQRGHQVRLVDTYGLSRAAPDGGPLARRLPAPGVRRFALYVTEAAARLTRPWGGRFSYPLLVAEHRLRGAILATKLPLDAFDLVICETPYDSAVLSRAVLAETWYDAPAPWADEMRYEGRLTGRQQARLRDLERGVFEGADYASFHWESYARYAVERYGISARNMRVLNFGCTPSPRRARFADPPRIVYLGNARARFQNPELLARLARMYPRIDMYAGTPPDQRLALNYCGYAPTLDVLGDYQAGLVTCSRDPLRQEGFSSKHLNYFAYGLPVLVPAWRRHLDTLPGSVAYTEETFLRELEALRDRPRWQSLSDLAYAQALRCSWDETLQPLADVLARTA